MTTATSKLLKLNKRIRGVAGGTSAGKTISILQILIDLAVARPNTLISVVSESYPHLKRGAMRDFIAMMTEHGYYTNAGTWNKTDSVFTFNNGSKIEFFSADQPHKVRGPRRDVLFLNEANNVSYEAWTQLLIRTKLFAIADWNPTNEFWFYTEILGKRDDVDFETLTYKDNEALDEAIVREIESRKGNKNWWLVYGLGQLGEFEGQVYTNWKIIDDVPHEARLERRGLDYGYTNDPTALVDIYYYNGGYILDEQLYRKGLSNSQIAAFINNLPRPQTLVVPDSAEPKSNDELKLNGIPIMPAVKGQGSVMQGIQYVQDQQISVTKRSVNIIKEYRNYLWKTDKDGKTLNVPEDMFNHSMDAIRYAIQSYKHTDDEEPVIEHSFEGGFY